MSPNSVQDRTKLLCLVCFALGIGLAVVLMTAVPSPIEYVNARMLRETALNRHIEKLGPWGKLEAIQIPFANPDAEIPDRQERLQETKWFFEGANEQSLEKFFNSCDLRSYQRRLLRNKENWKTTPEGIEISPDDQLIWSLNSKSRSKIYSVLAKSSANYPQCYPFRFSEEGLEAALRDSGLPNSAIEKLNTLTYTDGGGLCFADLRAAEMALHPSDFLKLVETLWAVPAYLLRLHVEQTSDIKALVKYWGKGGREDLITPLISTLARVPGGGALNVSYLLPPFARLRVYTYPEAWHNDEAAKEDCVISALNFFNDTLDPKTLDKSWREQALNTQYTPVTDEPGFGDVVTMLDSQDQIFHASVYIANGFVFTKNGVNHSQPWMLMKLSDMVRLYGSVEKSGRVVFLRRKE